MIHNSDCNGCAECRGSICPFFDRRDDDEYVEEYDKAEEELEADEGFWWDDEEDE